MTPPKNALHQRSNSRPRSLMKSVITPSSKMSAFPHSAHGAVSALPQIQAYLDAQSFPKHFVIKPYLCKQEEVEKHRHALCRKDAIKPEHTHLFIVVMDERFVLDRWGYISISVLRKHLRHKNFQISAGVFVHQYFIPRALCNPISPTPLPSSYNAYRAQLEPNFPITIPMIQHAVDRRLKMYELLQELEHDRNKRPAWKTQELQEELLTLAHLSSAEEVVMDNLVYFCFCVGLSNDRITRSNLKEVSQHSRTQIEKMEKKLGAVRLQMMNPEQILQLLPENTKKGSISDLKDITVSGEKNTLYTQFHSLHPFVNVFFSLPFESATSLLSSRPILHQGNVYFSITDAYKIALQRINLYHSQTIDQVKQNVFSFFSDERHLMLLTPFFSWLHHFFSEQNHWSTLPANLIRVPLPQLMKAAPPCIQMLDSKARSVTEPTHARRQQRFAYYNFVFFSGIRVEELVDEMRPKVNRVYADRADQEMATFKKTMKSVFDENGRCVDQASRHRHQWGCRKLGAEGYCPFINTVADPNVTFDTKVAVAKMKCHNQLQSVTNYRQPGQPYFPNAVGYAQITLKYEQEQQFNKQAKCTTTAVQSSSKKRK